MSRVVDFDYAPRVLSCAYAATTDLDDFIGADNGEGHQAAEFRVLLNSVLVIFFNVVGEVVDGDAIVFNVFHDEFLGFGELGWSERVGFSDDGNDIDARREAFHELDIEFAETRRIMLVQALLDTIWNGAYP